MLARQVEAQPGMAFVEAKNDMQAEACPELRLRAAAAAPAVRPPQRGEAAAGAMHGDGEALQFHAIAGAACPYRPGATRLRREFDGFVEKLHGYPSILAASWNQRTR